MIFGVGVGIGQGRAFRILRPEILEGYEINLFFGANQGLTNETSTFASERYFVDVKEQIINDVIKYV